MNAVKRNKKRAFVNADDCVACGCCAKACPIGAIRVWKGIRARVDETKCVGCGLCARECPASVIEVREVEA